MVFAITGSGKSIFIAQLCACLKTEKDEAIVVSTSRQKLVRQIRDTVKDRLETDDFMAEEVVGSYFAESKQADTRVIVACNDSLESLAETLQRMGRKTAMWFVDEAHHAESPRLLSAYEKLTPERVIGFTATPYRSNIKQGLSTFDKVICRYTLDDALRDGNVIVEWVARGWEGPETDRNTACLQMMREWCDDKIVCNADSIADAEDFAKYCNDNNWSAKAVHSKLSHTENDRIMEELRTGQIRLVVYCDLIAEGCDYPWLKSMVLRRVVGSRTRFVQELGRGLRYFKDEVTGEEKKFLNLLDPHDLLSTQKLTHREVLAGDFDPDEAGDEEDEGERMERALQQECFEFLRHLTSVRAGKEPVSSSALASYLSQLVSIFDVFKLIDKKIVAREWRRQPASEKQIQAMQNMKCWLSRGVVPPIHRTALEALTGMGSHMNRGTCSDLIDIEMSLASKKQWPKFSQLDEIVRQGLERHQKKKLGGGMANVLPGSPTARVAADMATAQRSKIETVQGLLFGDTGALKK